MSPVGWGAQPCWLCTACKGSGAEPIQAHRAPARDHAVDVGRALPAEGPLHLAARQEALHARHVGDGRPAARNCHG